MKETIRILLVEDNLINQKVLGHMIDGLGSASAEAVESGEAALERLRSEPFDLVIMDMQLDGMSGPEAISEIRKLQGQATSGHIPVVVLSGYADPKKEQEARQAGANRYLLKPLAVEELQELLEAVRSTTV